jgi:AcrR family transcriptional regulator
MAEVRRSTHDRLIQAALSLFLQQGITETTTREIADQAEVNEVTLFRHFKSKHGLLVALLEANHGSTVGAIAPPTGLSFAQAIHTYGMAQLEHLAAVPEFVRSLIGESGIYPPEACQALQARIQQIHQHTQVYLQAALAQDPIPMVLPVEQMATLLNQWLLGYAVLELTGAVAERDRARALQDWGTLLQSAPAPLDDRPPMAVPPSVMELPADQVRTILLRAKRSDPQAYALTYTLFGAGLRAAELVRLDRSHHISNSQQQVLQVEPGRQVPLNRWILGHRYGSYARNPLTQWLKTRKDDHPALFLQPTGDRWTVADLDNWWAALVSDLNAPDGTPPRLNQIRHTWCIDMVMRGMSLDNLSILTGDSPAQLQPYARRSRERIALENAIAIDQKETPRDDGGAP